MPRPGGKIAVMALVTLATAAPARPKLPEGTPFPAYAGFSLGMTRMELMATLRDRGFRDFFDVDASTRNGEKIPKDQLMDLIRKTSDESLIDPEKKNFPCLLRHPSKKDEGQYVTCAFKPSPLEPISQLALYLSGGRLARIDFCFHNAKTATPISAVEKHFGATHSTGSATEFLQTSPGISLENVGCRDNGCRISGWHKKISGKPFVVWAIYRFQHPDEGRTVSLRIAWDTPLPRTARQEPRRQH